MVGGGGAVGGWGGARGGRGDLLPPWSFEFSANEELHLVSMNVSSGRPCTSVQTICLAVADKTFLPTFVRESRGPTSTSRLIIFAMYSILRSLSTFQTSTSRKRKMSKKFFDFFCYNDSGQWTSLLDR